MAAAPTAVAAPAAAAPSAVPAPAAAPAAPAAGTPQPPVSAAAEPSHPKLCEVEFGGDVKYTGKLPANHHFTVFVAQGDCLAPGAHIVATAPVTAENKFFSEVFVKWGSDLSFCVAAVEAPDKPTTLYGKAPGKFHAEKTGEVEFRDLVFTPKPGSKKVFPPVTNAL